MLIPDRFDLCITQGAIDSWFIARWGFASSAHKKGVAERLAGCTQTSSFGILGSFPPEGPPALKFLGLAYRLRAAFFSWVNCRAACRKLIPSRLAIAITYCRSLSLSAKRTRWECIGFSRLDGVRGDSIMMSKW
jgi:hypothetical protein